MGGGLDGPGEAIPPQGALLAGLSHCMEAEKRVMLGEVVSPGSPLTAHLVGLMLEPPLGEKPERHLVLSTWSYVGAFFFIPT